MPKLKTHRGAAKRFRVTRSGKVMGNHSTKSHKLVKKGPARRQDLRGPAHLTETDGRRVKRLLPYHK